VATIALMVSPVVAQRDGDNCDRLAASPTDQNKTSEGVQFDQIDADAAIRACTEATRAFPAVKRFKFQLARALQKAWKYEEAAILYDSLAAAGYASAANNLARLYLEGTGVPQDPTKAIELYRKSAAQGNARAQHELGQMYENGRGLSTDKLKAYVWYRLAAAAGYDAALLSLGKISQIDLSDNYRQSYENKRTVSVEEKVTADEFLSQHRDLALPAAIRDRGQAVQEAVVWLEKAITKGSTEAQLLLAKLYLEENRLNPPGRGAFLNARATGSRERLGSVSKAAELYQQAIASGSNAGRINRAVLHEAGHGVEKSLTVAARLYGEVVGSERDGPAQLGLLRISFKEIWEREFPRWRQALVAGEDIQPAQDDITIQPSEDRLSVTIAVTDRSGRRVFSGSLDRGEQYRPPRGRRDLILWTPGLYGKDVRIFVGSRRITLPDDIRSYGIPLDPIVLTRVGSFLIRGSDGFTEEMLQKSRIQIRAITNSDVYIHSDDHEIGLRKPNLFQDDVLQVPNVDATLELRKGTIQLLVDGKNGPKLSAGLGCLATLRLDPKQLATAQRTAPDPEDCRAWKDEDAAFMGIVSRAGDSLSQTRKEKTVPGVHDTQGFIGTAWTVLLVRLNFDQRWDELLRARRIFLDWTVRVNGPNSFPALSAALELAEVEIRLGETSSARARLETAHETINRLGSIPLNARLRFYVRFSSLLTRLGRHMEAERFLLIAAALLDRQNFSAPGDRQGVYELLSEVSEKLGDFDRAIAYKLELLLLDQLEDPERSDAYNTERRPIALVQLIGLLRRTGRHDWFMKLLPFSYHEAKRDLGLLAMPEPFKLPIQPGVKPLSGSVDSSALMANALAVLARTYSWMNRHEEALPLFEQQARTLRNVFGEGSPQASAALASVANEHRLAGRNMEALAFAREAFGSALRYVNSRRSLRESARAAEDALRPATFALLEALSAPERLSKASGYAAEAFEAAQRLQSSKASLALQAFGERLGQNEPKLQNFVRRRQDLTEQLKRLDESLLVAVANGLPSGSSEANIRDKIRLTENQLLDLDSSRPAKLREFDELAEARILPYRELAKLLQPDEALITFADGEDATFAFVATREQLRSVRIELGADALDRMVIILRCGLDQQQWVGQAQRRRCAEATNSEPRARSGLPFDLQTAHELYRVLLGPFEDVIANKQLLVVPTGAMTSLPLHVLVTKLPLAARASSPADYRGVAWLGRQHAITVLPSVGNLLSLRTAAVRTHAPKPYIGFGDPTLPGSDHCPVSASASDCPQALKSSPKSSPTQVSDLGARESIESTRSYYRGTLADVSAVRRICPLPDTARELSCVAKMVSVRSGRILQGRALTEAAVKREPLNRYRIIHFATHGLLADELRGVDEPALVLTPPDIPSSDDDGLLTASEIAQLNLNADWVVLSACNTAGAERAGAEALSGLARAFFYAGARALLVSHWKVWSSAAVLLTTRAFAEIATDPKIGRAEALRRSMAAMMDDSSSPALAHPQYWAPFTLIGEGGPVER
jgi:CHAT domain-containing protein/TPR repeat protein